MKRGTIRVEKGHYSGRLAALSECIQIQIYTLVFRNSSRTAYTRSTRGLFRKHLYHLYLYRLQVDQVTDPMILLTMSRKKHSTVNFPISKLGDMYRPRSYKYPQTSLFQHVGTIVNEINDNYQNLARGGFISLSDHDTGGLSPCVHSCDPRMKNFGLLTSSW
jgi:hypothetical protein